MDVFPKFIVEDDAVIISKVTYHKDMAIDKKNVRGGGLYEFDGSTFTLYGESSDFGLADVEEIKDAIKNDKVYTNPSAYRSIAKNYDFLFKTNQGEFINLKE